MAAAAGLVHGSSSFKFKLVIGDIKGRKRAYLRIGIESIHADNFIRRI
jgi:hypothetical protein